MGERQGGPTSASLSPYGISPSSDPDSTVRSRYCPKPRVIFCRQRASKIQPRSPQLSSPSMEAYSNAITRVERIIIACLDISSLFSIFQSLLSNPVPSYLYTYTYEFDNNSIIFDDSRECTRFGVCGLVIEKLGSEFIKRGEGQRQKAFLSGLSGINIKGRVFK